jgi:hypothetical protein
VTVGALPLGRTRLCPNRLPGVVAQHPGLRIATVEGSFETLAASLRAGDIDFILGALRPADYAQRPSGIRSPTTRWPSSRGASIRGRSASASHPRTSRVHVVLPRVNTPIARCSSARSPSAVAASRRRRRNERPAGGARCPRQLESRDGDLAAPAGLQLRAGLLQVLPFPLPDTRRVIGVTQRTDSVASPGAKILIEEIARRCLDVLDPIASDELARSSVPSRPRLVRRALSWPHKKRRRRHAEPIHPGAARGRVRSNAALAQPYPAKPVKVVVGYTPGGSNDVLARVAAKHLQDTWKQSFIVENKPGASGQIGAETGAKAAPDGYTLVVIPNDVLTVQPHMFAKFPFDPVAELQPVATLAPFPSRSWSMPTRRSSR